MPDRLDSTIAETSQLFGKVIRARIGWQMAAAVGGCLWIGLLLDRWIEPSSETRKYALISLSVIGALWWLICYLPQIFYRPQMKEFVGILCKARPDLADSLVAATQVAFDPTKATGKAINKGSDQTSELQRKQSKELYETNRHRLNHELKDFNPAIAFKNPRKSLAAQFAKLSWAAAILLAFVYPSQAGLYLKRLALSEDNWPRKVKLVPDGFTFDSKNNRWSKHYARGSSVELAVWADLVKETVAPDTVRLKSLSFSQQKLADSMLRVGEPLLRGGIVGDPNANAIKSQRYRIRLEELNQTLSLRLQGGDDQIEVQLIASDRPLILSSSLKVIPPKYLAQEEKSYDTSQLTAIPEGSTVELLATSSKALSQVSAQWIAEGEESTELPSSHLNLDAEPKEVLFRLKDLYNGGKLMVSLLDKQQISSANPYDLPIEVLADESPTVTTQFQGIGKLVTSKAILPTSVLLKDDYVVIESILVIEINDGKSNQTTGTKKNADRNKRLEIKVDLPQESALSLEIMQPIDLEALSEKQASDEKEESLLFRLVEGDRIRLYALAKDGYDLSERPPTKSEPRLLTVVSSEELLNHLSERERELRKTLEANLADARRLAYSISRSQSDAQPTNQVGEWALESSKLIRDLESIVSRTDDIKREILNNRLDQPALVDRLKDSVIAPLRELLETDLAMVARELERSLEISQPLNGLADLSNRTNHVVIVIETVIEAMQANESYNEVVATLRRILREQKRLNRLTQKEQQDEARRLLLD